MKNIKYLSWPAFSLLLFIIISCATLSPGADPLVVRTEQSLTVANGTFDFVLGFDNAERGFWKTNAPAFHTFCEFLRTPVNYNGTNVPRCVEMQLLVDDDKNAYKAAKSTTSSNTLFSVLLTLESAIGQANSWSNIITTPTH